MTQPHAHREYALAPSAEHSYVDDAGGNALEDAHDSPELDDHLHIASVREKKRLWWRNALINLLFIGSWFFFSILLSVYNKWMFSPEHFGFPFPLFVTTLHMFVQFILAACLRALWPTRFKPRFNPNKADYARKTVPCAVTTSLDIGLSNLSLRTITLSFFTMCKSSSLIFVLGFAFLFRLETFSLRLIGVIFLIVAGVILMVATETHFILGGFIMVISASALGGLRWSLTQLLLKNKKMGMDNPAATIFWLSPVMGLTLALVSLVIDRWTLLFTSQFFDGFWTSINTIMFLMFPGVMAFCMVLSEFYIIQRAGIVPMSIAGIAKEVTTISISAWFFGDELTPLNITGVAITFCGIVLFTYHRYRKSIDSTVPLDAHGNPPTDHEDLSLDRVILPRSNSGHDAEEDLSRSRMSQEANGSTDSSRLLFSVGSDEELVNAAELRTPGTSKPTPDRQGGTANGTVHEIHNTLNTERVWADEEGADSRNELALR